MAVSFLGQGLFDSGPHRVRETRAGRLVTPPNSGDNFTSFTLDLAPLELRLEQTGRLVAADVAQLAALSDAIRAVAEGEVGGVLTDGVRSWPSVRMLRYEPGETVDRGRTVSMGYRIDYRQML
jgi:hypothetical protein